MGVPVRSSITLKRYPIEPNWLTVVSTEKPLHGRR